MHEQVIAECKGVAQAAVTLRLKIAEACEEIRSADNPDHVRSLGLWVAKSADDMADLLHTICDDMAEYLGDK